MNGNFAKRIGMLTVAVFVSVSALLLAQSKTASAPAKASAKPSTRTPAGPPSSEKVIQFVRETYGVADNVSIAVNPFRSSADPAYLDSTILVDDGQNTQTSKRSSEISVSKDGRYLVMSRVPSTAAGVSAFFTLAGTSKEDVEHAVRNAFHLPPTMTMTVGPPQSSSFPNFNKVTVTVDDGKRKTPVDTFVTKDRHFIVIGDIFDMAIDPRSVAMRTLVLQNQPESGPKTAPVTIVEFADLECPTCARAHDFLEKTLLPKYQGQVRLVYKEFPLQMHEWAMPAAIANQCAYRINPANYVPFRTFIFQHQGSFEAIKSNSSAVRDMLMDFGQQVGIDKLQLEGCYDSKASLPRIEANMKEGNNLKVNSTPTFFINGRMLVGMVPGTFEEAINDALRNVKKKK